MTTLPPTVSLSRRIWRGFWFVLLVLALLFHIVGGWIYAGRIIDDSFLVESSPEGSVSPGDSEVSGLDLEVVAYPSELGPMEAWQVEGSRSEWVIHVHGKGASPAEAMRLMPALDRAGFHQLAITYRNDPGQPADPSGYYQYGREEWNDVAAAVDYVRAAGATQVILVGYGAGGAIALASTYRTADDIAALVLDAPNLDMSATVDHRATRDEIAFGVAPPVTLIATAKMVAGLRASINWSALDYAKRIGQLTVPTLIFHGTEDDWVPISTSREVAEARPQFVTLVEIDGAGHLESWNADPVAYEARVLDFLEDALAR